jgi:hypothetical protein
MYELPLTPVTFPSEHLVANNCCTHVNAAGKPNAMLEMHSVQPNNGIGPLLPDDRLLSEVEGAAGGSMTFVVMPRLPEDRCGSPGPEFVCLCFESLSGKICISRLCDRAATKPKTAMRVRRDCDTLE